MSGVVLHMVALYVMGTCISGVQPAKEGETTGDRLLDSGNNRRSNKGTLHGNGFQSPD